ncbi:MULTISPECIES: TIGR02301 family protein [unclassified Hyphomicrobium]|uniref:TIGR02301 family protein n=1 Tax=unclassified Hyphomicrobium TaxID=2619925 RepID=UPI00030D6A4C|nr:MULTISPECIES: TIGR02301 family protein [unclassified Hyphomicrobium]
MLDARVKRHCRKLCQYLVMLMLALSAVGGQAFAASDSKPYDDRLMRLSEILGAIHYLRELCGANEGQYWRDRMHDLMNAEGSTALRRAKLTRAFNQGYRSYSRTYNTCSPSAQTAITRFLSEGSELSDGMLKAFPN